MWVEKGKPYFPSKELQGGISVGRKVCLQSRAMTSWDEGESCAELYKAEFKVCCVGHGGSVLVIHYSGV